MKLPTILLSLSFLFLAFPQQTSTALSKKGTQTFYLRTHLKRFSCFNYRHFNGLYLYASPSEISSWIWYNVLFTPNISLASHGFLDDTNPANAYQNFYLHNNETYGLGILPDVESGWLKTLMTIRSGMPGFAFADMGKTGKALVASPKSNMASEWGGWLICDWSKNAPELFARNLGKPYPAPRGCADVDLIQVLL
ncbi:hypothetical protein K432DRAFT_468496 [Lepidopterella palustris CBS 459.81]|uniref:DUF7907 domain-containing protein n=1 Tax=Lepidopterella palustris CBS 459.81 TaxID=1314670 RepID=A0A8E2DZT1_9PEZI|nr:hypothetical protein K432DRAFT_468496 [Lepidopterella palustris CBS 459.81]